MGADLPILHHHLYRLYHPVDIVHYGIVPNAKDSVAQRLEIASPFVIVFLLLKVLAPVQFDDQFFFFTGKVRKIASYRILPSEFYAKLLRSYAVPKFFSDSVGLFLRFLAFSVIKFPVIS